VNALHPIYTARTECQDCYKCIRLCPVKAIKVEAGCATVVSELCVSCGHCVEICPHGAKRVRDDRRAVERALAARPRVIVSLAPSFVSEFPGVSPAQLVCAFRQLGFSDVSETALGAQEVSAQIAGLIATDSRRVLISTACPVVVDYFRKYQPRYAGALTGLLSPLLTHTKLLRHLYGDQIGVVFVGPCIAKKCEADDHPELLDAALTFADVKAWFERKGIVPGDLEPIAGDRFIPEPAHDGALYPIEGGMSAGVEACLKAKPARFVSISGIHNIAIALEGLNDSPVNVPVFLELLACEGGCVNGPQAAKSGTLAKRLRVLDYAPSSPSGRAAEATVPIAEAYPAKPLPKDEFREAQIREVLRSVGKHSPEDELNCGGCGYDSCREFAAAFLMGRAERKMCVTYMRKLAQKKTHALMQKMPSAVVIVDERLKVIECNPNFVRFFGGDEVTDPQELEGVELDTLVPFYRLFRSVLESGQEILNQDIRFGGRIFNASVFSVEKHSVLGGIFRDTTKPALEKEQIIERTRQVIQKNLLTVQQIAYLIGENAAESEIALNSIVDSFSPENMDSKQPGHDQ
jgi:iron only hydrogenase large subunit-like protein